MIFIFVEFFYTGEGEQKGPGDFAYVDVGTLTQVLHLF